MLNRRFMTIKRKIEDNFGTQKIIYVSELIGCHHQSLRKWMCGYFTSTRIEEWFRNNFGDDFIENLPKIA